MLKKLRHKIVAVTMAIVLAMLIIIFGLVYYFTQSSLQEQADTALNAVASAAEKVNYPAVPRPSVQLPYFVFQINIWGDVVASGNTHFDLEDKALVETLILEVYKDNKTSGYLPDYNLRYRLKNAPGNQTISFVDVASHSAALALLVRNSLVIGIFSLAAFFALAVFLAYWAVKPVDKAWQQQKQFISDASHELKTPLTVIISNTELLQNGQDLPEEGRQFADNIMVMSRKMRNLTEGLLELSRADNGQVKKNFANVDLSRMAEEAVLPFEPVFFEQNMTLRWQIEPNITCNGNEQYLRQVLDILLDNARKYSDPGAVVLHLKRQGKQCLLTLSNPGQPIPAQEREKIFDRFYRSDRARSRSDSFGLGLSIAKSVVQEHGGRIWVESNPSGNCFCLTLPIL